jgi:hypothetical protein
MDKTKFTLETFSFPLLFCNQLDLPGVQIEFHILVIKKTLLSVPDKSTGDYHIKQ